MSANKLCDPKDVGELIDFLSRLPRETQIVRYTKGATCALVRNDLALHFIESFAPRGDLEPVKKEEEFYGLPVLFL